jgi:hypothetical protein
MQKMYSVYSWLQILLGPLPTAMLAYIFAPMLRDTSAEQAPPAVEEIKNLGERIAAIALK